MPTWGGGLSCAGELLEFSSEWYWYRKIRGEGGGGVEVTISMARLNIRSCQNIGGTHLPTVELVQTGQWQ